MDLEALRLSARGEVEAEEACHRLMQDVVEEATHMMMNNHHDRVSIPYTVRAVCKEMLDFIELAFVGQDSGNVRSAGWHADPVAGQIPIDTYARGAVKVRPARNAVVPAAEPSKAQSSKQEKKERTGLMRKVSERAPKDSSDRLKIDVGGAGRRRSSATSGKGTPRAKKDAVAVPPADEKHAEDHVVDAAAPYVEEDPYTKQVRLEAKQRQDQRALTDKLASQIDDPKTGKEFIVDALAGKVIPVKHASASEHVSRKLEIRYGIGAGSNIPTYGDAKSERKAQKADAAKEAEKAKEAKEGGKKSKDDKTGKADSGGSRRRKNKIDNSEFVISENNGGPMIATLAPTGGVQVKDEGGTRKSDMKHPKTKVTRGDYGRMVSMQAVGGDDSGRNTPITMSANVTNRPARKDVVDANASHAITPPSQMQGEKASLQPQGIVPLPLHRHTLSSKLPRGQMSPTVERSRRQYRPEVDQDGSPVATPRLAGIPKNRLVVHGGDTNALAFSEGDYET